MAGRSEEGSLDIGTHALTALTLMRGFFPRRGWAFGVGMVVAGTLADVDGISALFGPGAYLSWHGTYTHSVLGTLVVVAIATLVVLRLGGEKVGTVAGIVGAMALTAAAHVLMDVCQSDGVALLWPVSGRRFAADILPRVDAWILALLVLGIAVPELFRLVGSEIGARDTAPRGRNGAIVALALILVYVGARFALHAIAVVEMDAHAYKGESPRRVGAFADALSVFKWHGVVETQSLMCTVEVAAGPESRFDADAAYCQHKPESSAALELAEKTEAAQRFLRVARFPKATVERIEVGYEVSIRAVQNEGESEMRQRVAAWILLDEKLRVTEEELIWNAELGRR